DQQYDADDSDDAEIHARAHQREQRANSRRGKRREDGHWMNKTLIENAEHDIDGDDRGDDESQFSAERGLEGECCALEMSDHTGGKADIALRLADHLHCLPERDAGGETEGNGG